MKGVSSSLGRPAFDTVKQLEDKLGRNLVVLLLLAFLGIMVQVAEVSASPSGLRAMLPPDPLRIWAVWARLIPLM